jgi:hypothetical protein
MVVTRFFCDVKLFPIPSFVNTEFPFPPLSEEELYRKLMPLELDEKHRGFSIGEAYSDMKMSAHVYGLRYLEDAKRIFAKIFEQALSDAVSAAVGVVAGYLENINDDAFKKSAPPSKRAASSSTAIPCWGRWPLLSKLLKMRISA